MRNIFGLACLSIVAALAPVTSVAAQDNNAPQSSVARTPGQPNANPSQLVTQFGLQESAKPVSALVKGWKKPEKIIVMVEGMNGSKRPDLMAWLQDAAPGVTLVPVHNEQEALAQIPGADGAINICSRKVIQASDRLKWIQFMSAGMDQCAPAVGDRDILVTNLQRVLAPVISDHVMALMLALMRGLDIEIAAQRDGKVGNPPAERMWEVRGRTLLVAGLGGIGTDVAKKAHALGMRVLATRNSGHEGPDFVEYVGLADELPTLIAQADVVVDSLPLTKETAGLFNAAMFARMKKESYFINIGRGDTVVQADLIKALNEDRILGAGLDVATPDQIPDGDPLYRAKNIILTHHTAAVAIGTGPGSDESWQIAKENLRRYVAGEKIYAVVDVKRGY